MSTTTFTTCTEAAQAFLACTRKADREAVAKAISERAAKSKRVRWQRLDAAVKAGDTARIRFRAAEGHEARAEAAKALKPAKPAKAPTKPAKPAAKPAAKAKPAKPAQDPLTDLVRKAKAAGLSPEEAMRAAAAYLQA